MSDLKEFKIVLEESDTGRQIVLPNVMASDYDVAEAYGNHVAAAPGTSTSATGEAPQSMAGTSHN